MLKIIEEIKNLIEEMNTKTSQELDLETVKNRLGEIVAKNQQAVTDQGVEKLQNEISELREKTEQVKQIILELPDFTEKKEEISAQSIQASDKILIEKIAEEFAKKRLEGKTLQVNFLGKQEGVNAFTQWKKDGSGFEIGIDISEEKNRIPVFRSLAHELAHNVILLKELKGKQSVNKDEDILYAHQAHSKSFWEVFLDKDNISKENDISTLEFVRSKLLPEDQKELDDFIKIENKEGGNKIARWVYFPIANWDLEGKVRRKKVLKTEDQSEAQAEWDKIRRTVLQLVDDSMNTPANEAEERWNNISGEKIRLIQVEVWTRTESKQSSDHGKFKIYVFHNYDSELPADLKKKLDEVLITDEKGEWEKEERMNEEKVKRLKNRNFPNICKFGDETKRTGQMQAQVLQVPETK